MTSDIGLGAANDALRQGNNPLQNRSFDSRAAAEQAAREFESFFLMQTMQEMFAGIGQDPLFGGGAGEEMFKSLLIQVYSTELTKAGGIGLADQVLGELIKTQSEPPL